MSSSIKKCFVIMPFGKRRTSIYRRYLKIYNEMIKPIVEACDYMCIRADELVYPGIITRDIIEYLYESDLVIADLTNLNANVFYELGVRHALCRCGTIPIIQEGDNAPFDLAFYRLISYSKRLDNQEDFRKELKSRIKAFEMVRSEKNDNQVYETLRDKLYKVDVNMYVPKEELWKALDTIKELQDKYESSIFQNNIYEKKNKDLKQQLHDLQQELRKLKKESNLIILPKLRTQPLKLSNTDVKNMLQKYDFYCGTNDKTKYYCNTGGNGIIHDYEINKEGLIVFDHTTGLMWQRGGSAKQMGRNDTKYFLEEINQEQFAGFTDWRLPTLEEAMSLITPLKTNDAQHIDCKFNKEQQLIWTSDRGKKELEAWVVDFSFGVCSEYHINYPDCYVRAVRSGQS